jgi:hypothetical protein
VVLKGFQCPVTYIYGSVIDDAWAVPSRRYLKKSSTESHRDLNFKENAPECAPGGYASETMAECIARLEETACPELVEEAS